MKRTVVALVLVTAMPFTPSSQTVRPITWEPFTFPLASGNPVEAERALVEVSERHGDPRSPKIRLPIIRLRASRPGAGLPMLWLEGGPGGSGVRTVTGSYPLFEELRAFGDVYLLRSTWNWLLRTKYGGVGPF